MSTTRMKLGEILIESELITPEQLDEALEMQKKVHSPLGELLIKQGYISQAQLYKTLEYMLRVPYIDIAATTVDPKATAVINESFAL
ncbi:MAG: type II secretion system protein GspE, partial [Clostridiales bacterium]|nr:type II secretion system protein GspE [Clostridiales bacterium]